MHRKLNPFQSLLAVILLGLLSQQFYFQVPADRSLLEIRESIVERVSKRELASISIGIQKNGVMLWKESFGWADREKRVRATPRTIYPMASLSKSITATAVWMLNEQGKLNVDEPVANHLTSVQLKYHHGTPDDLKIRHLLNMEGGIPHQFEYFYDRDGDKPFSLLNQIGQFGFVAFEPGEVHQYSNFSIGILDQLISDVSGKKFDVFMREAIFSRLGMKDTFVERPRSRALSAGYYADGKRAPSNFFLPRGGGGMYSSLDDLLLYASAHLETGKLMEKKTLDDMHAFQKDGRNPYYSSGWGVLPTSDGRVSLLSNGAIVGAATTLLLIPKANISIVCLSNSTVGNEVTDKIAFDIAGALLEGYSESMSELFARVEPEFASRPYEYEKSIEGEWRGFVKTGQSDFPITLNFVKDGNIFAALQNKKAEKVTNAYFEQGLFYVEFPGTIATSNATRRPHSIVLKLILKGRVLYGVAAAISTGPEAKFHLPYYVEVRKTNRKP